MSIAKDLSIAKTAKRKADEARKAKEREAHNRPFPFSACVPHEPTRTWNDYN